MDGIHLSKDGVTSGPYTPDQISALLRAGEFSPSDHYWQNGMEAWQPLENLKLESISEIEIKRLLPTSVAISSRLKIIIGIQSLLEVALLPLLPLLIHRSAHSPVPSMTLMQGIEGFLIAVCGIGCGWAMLRGKRSGRIGYLALTFFGLIRPFLYGHFRPSLAHWVFVLPSVVMAFFLFRPPARRFFNDAGPIEKSELYGYGCLICLYLSWILFNVSFGGIYGVVSSIHLARAMGLPGGNPHLPIFTFWAALVPWLLSIFLIYFGLALNRFHAWKRDFLIIFGIAVLLSCSSLWSVRHRSSPNPLSATTGE